jgi:hypothetical protein
MRTIDGRYLASRTTRSLHGCLCIYLHPRIRAETETEERKTEGKSAQPVSNLALSLVYRVGNDVELKPKDPKENSSTIVSTKWPDRYAQLNPQGVLKRNLTVRGSVGAGPLASSFPDHPPFRRLQAEVSILQCPQM